MRDKGYHPPMSFLSIFSEHSAALFPKIGSDTFASSLADMLKALLPIDNVTILAYPNKNLPRVEYNEPPPEHRRSTIDMFVNGAFLMDPYYLAATKQGKQGFYPLNDIAPSGFLDSEYYQIYYKSAGFVDECGYLIQLIDDSSAFVNISLGRINIPQPFNDEELSNLAAITPIITWLSRQHWPVETDTPAQPDLRNQLETALECFGSSLLTDRERQMVKMILHGHSNKAISERLNISVETVKLHRKNAYAKLDIGTQGELFHLFLGSLMSIKDYEDGDPLTYYHTAQKSS